MPFDLTRLDASIVSGTTPIGGFDIKIIRPNGDVRTVKSTDHGKFGGLIPSNENLQFEFWFDGIRVANIPFQTNSEEKVVHSFDVKIPHPAVISGSVKGCLGTNVDRGTVVVNDWFLYPIKDGKYSIELPYVEGKEFRIRAIYLNGESSPTQEFTITSKTIAIEDLSLCSNTDTEDDFSISFKLDGVSYDIKGLKKIVETDSILSFRGGKAALDFSFNNEFLLNFYKDGAWGSSNQFSIKLFENNGYGAIQVEGRERVSVDNLDVVVINRNPYKVLFSGSFIYYDNQSQSIKTVMLTEGQIFEK